MTAFGQQDDIEIVLSLNRNKIGLNETATLTVTVSGSSQQQLPEPKLPPLPQFQIFSSGSSTNLQIINGVMSSSNTFNYVLSPKKEGSFPIRSATLLVNGKRYTSNELSITVVKSSADAAGSATSEVLNNEGNSRDLFVVAEVDKKTAYVDEQVTLSIKYCRAIQTRSSPDYTPPLTPDFWTNDIPPQKQYYQNINGRRYLINELRTALFPTKPGELSISSARVSVVVPDRSQRRSRDPFSFFDGILEQGKRIDLKSKSLTVNVKPLPREGKTENFSGGVGRYKISAEVDKTEVEVNEAIALTVKISGQGNVKSIPEPTLPELDGFRVEKASTDYKVSNLNDQLGGTKTYEYLLIPRLPGNHRIEPITLNYFDPGLKKYKNASTAQIELIVDQGDVAQSDIPYNMVSGQILNLNETDIRFIKVENGSLKSRGRILLTSPLFLIVMSLPLVIVLGGMIDVKRKRRLAHDIGYARQRRATAEAKKRLKKAEEYLREGKDADFYAELSAAVYQFIADKFNVSAHGLTSDSVRDLLQQGNVTAELSGKANAVLNAADFGRFAGGSGPDTKKEDLFKQAREVVVNLEEVI